MTRVDALIGGQWGDEGKAKIVDVLAKKYDMIVRFQGGANAGHTIHVNETEKFICHQLPSGMLYEHTANVLASGMVIDPIELCKELEDLSAVWQRISSDREDSSGGHAASTTSKEALSESSADVLGAGINAAFRKALEGRLYISDRASLVLPHHKLIDAISEQKTSQPIGTTKRGIGPAYGEHVLRSGLRVGDLKDFKVFRTKLSAHLRTLSEDVQKNIPADLSEWFDPLLQAYNVLAPYITDTVSLLHTSVEAGKELLLEGAQGTGLDVNFGTYPYVTSSSTTIGGALVGTGLSPQKIGRVYGIFKAYVTRVGEGVLPTLIHGDGQADLQQRGHEVGATTGRIRRCGWFDAVQARYTVRINGISDVVLTKLDTLAGLPTIRVARAYRIRGEETSHFPARIEDLEVAEPIYEDFPGWPEGSVRGATHYDTLPEEAKAFIAGLERLLVCPITLISTGPKRGELISRKDISHEEHFSEGNRVIS